MRAIYLLLIESQSILSLLDWFASTDRSHKLMCSVVVSNLKASTATATATLTAIVDSERD